MTDRDDDGKLTNFSYSECNNDCNDEIKSCRGLVYKNEQPFMKAFGYTPNYTTTSIPEETKLSINKNFHRIRCFPSLEGTLLRLFYNDVNDKWYLSTHKKLNGRNSRWGSKYTFGELFDSVIPPDFYTTLDKHKFYLFILTPNHENRIVCTHFMNQVFHVATYDSNFNLCYDHHIGIQKPMEIKFKDPEHMYEFINKDLDYMKYQGIVMCDPETQTNIKIYSYLYDNWRKLRGNTPSVNFRYLELRNNAVDVHNLKLMFRDNIPTFDLYEKYLDTFSRKMLNEYIQRHIKKQFKQILPYEHYILKLAHAWHNEDRNNNKMNLNKIVEIINKQSPTFLNTIIKSYKN
jgi:hypothetical protein